MNNQNNEFLNWGEGFTAQEDEYVLLDEPGLHRPRVLRLWGSSH